MTQAPNVQLSMKSIHNVNINMSWNCCISVGQTGPFTCTMQHVNDSFYLIKIDKEIKEL